LHAADDENQFFGREMMTCLKKMMRMREVPILRVWELEMSYLEGKEWGRAVAGWGEIGGSVEIVGQKLKQDGWLELDPWWAKVGRKKKYKRM
jgi:hypothetical protein